MESVMEFERQFALRLPTDVSRWLREEAEINACSQNSEVVRALRERMIRVEAERAALAGEDRAA